MNIIEVRASLFAPAFRRRLAFATRTRSTGTEGRDAATEQQREMRNAKAFSRRNPCYGMPFAKFPGSGFIL